MFILVGVVLLIAFPRGSLDDVYKSRKTGWAALVPFYNSYLMIKISGRPTWWFFLLLIPGVKLHRSDGNFYRFCKELWQIYIYRTFRDNPFLVHRIPFMGPR